MFRDVPECSGMFRNVPCSGFYRRPFCKHRIGHGQEYFITTKMKGPLRICMYSLFDNDKIKRKVSILFSSRLRIYSDVFARLI